METILKIVATLPKKEIDFFIECPNTNNEKIYFILEKALNKETNKYYAYLYCSYYNENKDLEILCYDIFNQWRHTNYKITYFKNKNLIKLI